MGNRERIVMDKPIEDMDIEDKDIFYGDLSESEEDISEGFAVISLNGRKGKIFIRSWRAWLRFLTDELRQELYENMPDEYLNRFESDIEDIQRFVNIAIAGEDRFLLDEKLADENEI